MGLKSVLKGFFNERGTHTAAAQEEAARQQRTIVTSLLSTIEILPEMKRPAAVTQVIEFLQEQKKAGRISDIDADRFIFRATSILPATQRLEPHKA